MNSTHEMDVRLVRNESSDVHFEPGIVLYFVVDGRLTVTVRDSAWQLCKDNFMLINAGVSHGFTSGPEDTVFCCVQFSCGSVTQMSGEEVNLFYCNSTEQSGPEYHELRRVFHELVYTQIQRPHRTECLKQSVLYRLMDGLLENFRLDGGCSETVSTDDMKMLQVFQYISRNYAGNVSLSELADRMFMSKSTLSRCFKKETGIYFADYVNRVRMKYALEDLLFTDKTIVRIAVDNGFSGSSAFNRVFREQYGITPTEYRAQAGLQGHSRADRMGTDRALQEELKEKLSLEENAVPDNVSIRADMSKGVAYPKKWGECINIGSAYNLTIANLQYHTLYLKEQLGFRMVRVWSVFSKKLMISDGRTIGYYNYDMIDTVLDFLVANQIIPFLDFGNRPDTATYSPGSPVFCEEEYIPFASKAVWEDLLSDFILHITNRYGENATSHWLFEFSLMTEHDPVRNLYEDDHFSYVDAFSTAYKIIKRFLPRAMVGGPMAEVGVDYAFVSDFLRQTVQAGCPPDFVSFMLFPYRTLKSGDGSSTERTTAATNEKEQVQMMRDILRNCNATECRLFITEWNNSLSNRDYLNDSCCRAAYLIKKLTEVVEQTDLLILWMASDWVSSYYDTVSITNGGSGILTKDSIRKPAYYALEFLQRAGTTLIDRGANYLITQKRPGGYYILCFNFKWFAVNYFLLEEGIRDPEELRDIFEDSHPLDLELCLENLPSASEYIIKRRTVNEECGSILTEWKNFKYDRKLRSSDIKYIRECCIPKVSMDRAAAEEGILRLRMTLLPHEITLLHVYTDA